MMDYCGDTSALAKRYVSEAGSRWMRDLLDVRSGNTIHTVRITGAEMVSALVLRSRSGTLAPAQVAQTIERFKAEFRIRYTLIDVTAELVDAAMILAERHGLRGYDSVQLAAANSVRSFLHAIGRPAPTFISADRRLNGAALHEGLPVENPADRP